MWSTLAEFHPEISGLTRLKKRESLKPNSVCKFKNKQNKKNNSATADLRIQFRPVKETLHNYAD